jgi:hydrogenase maturation protein HypF
MQGFAGPLVMTSGNLSDEPQAIDDNDARERLAAIASYALVHDRRIANRVDDSVVRVMAGRARVLRRARGYAPAPLRLPSGFESAPQLLAFGGELKAAFCLLKGGEATLSQHQGDLEDERTLDDYRKNLALYARLFDHRPAAFVVDSHPDYVSSKFAREQGLTTSTPVMEAQHHHAHIAACLAENGRPLDAPPVLGVVLDGLGFGDDGTIWGGEFLLADYRRYERLGALRPVAMPGGARAVREPWRNLYAHLTALMDWPEFARHFSQLDLCAELSKRPLSTLEAMMRSGVNSPMASSCGRLFDAVAAALDICPDRQAYEGETGARLEAIVDESELRNGDEAHCYSFSLSPRSPAGLQYLEPATMWRALLDDLMTRTPPPIIAARFHKGLAAAIVAMTKQLARKNGGRARLFDTIALSGGCFQNHILFAEVVRRLEQADFKVLTHAEVPTNDGGLALGQAAIGGARLIDEAKRHSLKGGVRVAGA